MKNRQSTNEIKILWLLGIALLGLINFILSGCTTNRITHEQSKEFLAGNIKEQPVNPQSSSYIIQPGDLIKISIAGYPEFDTTAVVSASGTITMKVIGEIQTAGSTREQLTKQLITKLSDFVRTSVLPTVSVVNASTQKVAILGSVARQENYPITTEMSLVQVIALAGGVTSDADIQHIRIIRGGDPRNIVEVDISQYLEQGRATEIPVIKAGDVVFVPREENIIRELSNFFRDAIFLFSFFAIAQ